MQPAARIQASIEIWNSLWNETDKDNLPMDKIIGDYLRTRRYIGSKDRRDIADRIYKAMRHYGRLSWWIKTCEADAHDPRIFLICAEYILSKTPKDEFDALFNGEQYGPDVLAQNERAFLEQLEKRYEGKIAVPEMDEGARLECPNDLIESCRIAFGPALEDELKALTYEAKLHLRVNTRKSNRIKVSNSLKKEEVKLEDGRFSPYALRLNNSVHLTQTESFKNGWIDIQDEGSQLIALACAPQPGMQILDYCAGGGGKTLALADLMDGKGRIVAMDNNTKRLLRGKKRYIRADIHNVELRSLEEDRHRKWIKRQKDKFDVVLIDAPCSGTGTWRRNPDLRWRHAMQPELADIMKTQMDILSKTSAYVKIGGVIVYATCSLLPEENEQQVTQFLKAHPHFEIADLKEILPQNDTRAPHVTKEGFMRLTPFRHGTDGFFAARLIRTK